LNDYCLYQKMTASTREDADLLAACSNGDEQALGALYDRYGKLAYGVALRVLDDSALAEDAVQDAFVTVWRQAATYDPARGKASTWILMLVHRRAVDLVRRQHRFHARGVKLEAAAPQTPVENVDEGVVRRSEVQAALRTLSSAERQALGLAYWAGLRQSEIATALGIPSGTVNSRIFNAMAKLREALRQATDLAAVEP
jgi:RNA polymerase sigma factor (sigma-70 family)